MSTNETPIITVVTVTHNLVRNNRMKTFRQCLESIRSQECTGGIEHIVIDGDSRDGTQEFFKQLAKEFNFALLSEPDTGIYDAMNKGIVRARGTFVTFLNSDDFYHDPYGLEESVDLLMRTGADFSYGSTTILGKNGIADKTHPHTSPNIKLAFFLMPFCHQSMVTRKSVLVKEGMFDTSYKSAGDYELFLRLCLGGYKAVQVPLNFVTFRAGGFSSQAPNVEGTEVARAYRENYGKLCRLTTKESENIYCRQLTTIPRRLARKLKVFDEYFDYQSYKDQKRKFRWPWEKLGRPKGRAVKRLSIIGTGPGFERAKKDAANGREIWCTSSIFEKLTALGAEPGKIFQLHDEHVFEPFTQSQQARLVVLKRFTSVPRAKVMPVESLVRRFGEIFTSSVVWMLAYARDQGYTDISIHGVHMNEGPYAKQRDSFFYLLGALRASGMQINLDADSGIFIHAIRYGARM